MKKLNDVKELSLEIVKEMAKLQAKACEMNVQLYLQQLMLVLI